MMSTPKSAEAEALFFASSPSHPLLALLAPAVATSEEEDFWTRVAEYQLDLHDTEEAPRRRVGDGATVRRSVGERLNR